MRYIIATHTSYQNGVEIHGPAHTVYSFLKERGLNNVFIRHPLNPRKDDIYILKNGENDRKIRTISSISAFDNIFELLVNAYEVLKVREDVYFIGIDPLNALSGILCRLFFWKRIKVVYYIVDFSDTRFQNKLMDSVYTLLDKISCKYSSEVWCVSTRICSKKIQQGVERQKVQFVPNSPTLSSNAPHHIYNGNLNCVVVGSLSEYIDYSEILNAIAIVKKDFPTIKLIIIGDGDKRSEIITKIKQLCLQTNVSLLGSLSHSKVMSVLADCFVGIAIYSGKAGWNRYGDSMKAREYMTCGLPVIISDLPSTADDVLDYKCGLVLKNNSASEVADFVLRCINDNEYYAILRSNALKCAANADKNKILTALFIHNKPK